MSTPDVRAWAPRTTFGILVSAVVVTYLIPKQTLWVPRTNESAVPVALFPIPSYIWQTAGWALLLALLGLLLLRAAPAATAKWPDLAAKRITVVALASMWTFALLARLVTGKTQEPAIGPVAIGAAAALIVAAAILVLRPPRTAILIGGLVLSGLAARVLLISLTPLDHDYSDNLPAIVGALDRLVHGQTPYAFIDFGSHVNPMGYLPWTFLVYLPAFAAGWDIRVTNVVLSLAVAGGVLLFVRGLPLGATARACFSLLVALVYAAPNTIGFDLYVEWQLFTLALLGAFALVAGGRLNAAAASYGVALAAMPMALFCAPAMIGHALRAVGAGGFMRLLPIGALTASPIAAFLIWDTSAFVQAFTYAPLEFWQRLDAGDASWPYLLAWHGLLLGNLRIVQLGIVALVVFLAWRVRTPSDAMRLGLAAYLGITLSGPFIAPHVFSPMLWLVLVTTATMVASRVSASAAPAAGPVLSYRGSDAVGVRLGRPALLAPLRQLEGEGSGPRSD